MMGLWKFIKVPMLSKIIYYLFLYNSVPPESKAKPSDSKRSVNIFCSTLGFPPFPVTLQVVDRSYTFQCYVWGEKIPAGRN